MAPGGTRAPGYADRGAQGVKLAALRRHKRPFVHWIAEGFIDQQEVRAINAEWPDSNCPGWYTETGRTAIKSAVLFPYRLPPTAQALAVAVYSPETRRALSELVGVELLPDPWFTEGPTQPRVGGGLHEIHAGGLLKMHLDFNRHPSGLTRCVNLLIYLNEAWDTEWGGALELHGNSIATIVPRGGVAVMFRTTDTSWHGHPHPLTCPTHKSRRSLALYFYKQAEDVGATRITTQYRRA